MQTGTRAARWAGLGVLALSLGGCADGIAGLDTASIKPAAENVSAGFVPGVPKGYQCPLVPNGFDPAGSIYRLEKDGTYFRVKDFTTDPAITALGSVKREVPISNYVLSDTQQANAGLSFDLLQKVVPGLAASGAADYKKAMTVDIAVEDMVGEVIDDHVADKIVDLFKASMTPKRGSKYFLVRETVRAGAVSYKLKHTDLAKLGGKAEVEKLAQGAANVTVRDNDGVFEIKQTFKPDRMAICIKSAEIVIEGPAAASTVALKSADETPVPQIKRIGNQ
ncbi:hypothetical protein [Hyphomicrobium sp. LHD-15]|uniref:hypothetical protein n=1 Tax=Hyphomicrobium sp. LHD-15 TaxID=3072142 RepID=UPI00280DC161|nr:hypothetical protein [Hyphomicrobium sp. LHD-15]MDQ8700724.1 hypothetical protein [Hyphomicrobium sp. LHD-15]